MWFDKSKVEWGVLAPSAVIYWCTFPSVLGEILIAGFENNLVFLGVDSAYCAVRNDFFVFAHKKEWQIFERAEWPHFSISQLQNNIDYYWGALSVLSEGLTFSSVNLLITGTIFQKRVWLALSEVSYGRTLSYSEFAGQINCPKAVRAVASAVAQNPIPLWLPCHRIIQKSGVFGHFHWGPVLKCRLIEAEKKKVAFLF